MDHGINTAGLTRILGVANSPNMASQNLQTRVAFTLIREILWDGQPVVVNVYEKA